VTTLRAPGTGNGTRARSVPPSGDQTTSEAPAEGSRASRLARQADRAAAVSRLVTAAAGLASTIAVTEKLAQQRADLVTSQKMLRGPRRNGGHQAPIISLAEAAKRTGRHPEVLRRWCTDGRIPAVRIGRTWGITPETLALLMAHSTRSRPRLPTPDRA